MFTDLDLVENPFFEKGTMAFADETHGINLSNLVKPSGFHALSAIIFIISHDIEEA